jgi:hypothetical protein
VLAATGCELGVSRDLATTPDLLHPPGWGLRSLRHDLGGQFPHRHVASLGRPAQQVECLGFPAVRLGHDDALGLLDHGHGLQPGQQARILGPLHQVPARRGGPPLAPGLHGGPPGSLSLGQDMHGPLLQLCGAGAGSHRVCSGIGQSVAKLHGGLGSGN